jgi:hypothetical protein
MKSCLYLYISLSPSLSPPLSLSLPLSLSPSLPLSPQHPLSSSVTVHFTTPHGMHYHSSHAANKSPVDDVQIAAIRWDPVSVQGSSMHLRGCCAFPFGLRAVAPVTPAESSPCCASQMALFIHSHSLLAQKRCFRRLRPGTGPEARASAIDKVYERTDREEKKNNCTPPIVPFPSPPSTRHI